MDFGKEAVLLPKPPKRVPVTAGTDPQGDLLAPVVPAARKTDPPTSNDGIGDVLPRAGSQQHRLLLAYGSRPMGLIAEEAAEIAGLLTTRSCWWKRVGELLHFGLIEDTFTEKEASTGSMQRVCAITTKGKGAIK
jgi:hypothetical protein